MATMMVSVDKAGRVVIPKELRDRLSITEDTVLELTVDADGLSLSPVRRQGRRVIDVDGWPVIEALPGTSLSDAQVQRLRDEQR